MPSHYDQYTEANPETGYEDVEKPRVPSYDLVDLMSLIGGSASPTQPSAVAQPTDILTEEQFNAGQDVFGNGVSPTGIQSFPQDDAQGGPTLEEYIASQVALSDEATMQGANAAPQPTPRPRPQVTKSPIGIPLKDGRPNPGGGVPRFDPPNRQDNRGGHSFDSGLLAAIIQRILAARQDALKRDMTGNRSGIR